MTLRNLLWNLALIAVTVLPLLAGFWKLALIGAFVWLLMRLRLG